MSAPTTLANPEDLLGRSLQALSAITLLPRLPLEIHDIIVDYLWDDQSALAACSLASRDWLHTTRFHRFHTLHLRSANKCADFESLVNSSSDIVAYVRDLTLGVDPNGQWAEPEADDFWTDSRLPQLLVKLKNLECLRLDSWDWDPDMIPDETSSAILSLPHTIKELRLRCIIFRDPDGLLRLLMAYPNLSVVHMAYVSTSWPERIPEQTLTPPTEHREGSLRLHRLVIELHAYMALSLAVSLSNLDYSLASVDEVHWHPSEDLCSPIVARVLRLLVTSIESLQYKQLCFHRLFSRLESLHFSLSESNAVSDAITICLPVIARSISQPSPTKISEMKIALGSSQFLLSPMLDIPELMWNQLDEILAFVHSEMPQLSISFHVQLEARRDDWMDSVVAAFNSGLHTLNAQGARIK